MIKSVLSVLFLLSLAISTSWAQSGFQLGFGAGTMLLSQENKAAPFFSELADFQVEGGESYFVNFNTDYAFKPHWQLKSGIQWRWRSIKLFEGQSEIKTMLSVPLILNYRMPFNKRKDMVLGFNIGISIDNYIPNTTEKFYTIESQNVLTTIAHKNYIYNGALLSFNGALRLGLEVEKNFESHGRVGLFVMYNHQRGNTAKTISVVERTVYSSDIPTQIDHVVKETIEFNEDQTGYLVGLNYYFNSFQANNK